MIKEIVDYLKVNDVEYKENYPLSKLSSVRIGNDAFIVAYPKDVSNLIHLINFLESSKFRYKILGRMSNVLPPDEKYLGVVVKTDRIAERAFDHGIVEAAAGASLPALAIKTCNMGLSGLEELSGIPGSIAGAIYGNAGAFGREISDLIVDIRVYDKSQRKITVLSCEECGFGYRASLFKREDCVILSARLALACGSVNEIKAGIHKYKSIREGTQPKGASLGSTFKRTEGISAGKMIDSCGLKGYRIGGAEISHVHAGFIVNAGGATAADYIKLADHAAECVYKKYGVLLEREIEKM